jgi:hypothetical protein
MLKPENTENTSHNYILHQIRPEMDGESQSTSRPVHVTAAAAAVYYIRKKRKRGGYYISRLKKHTSRSKAKQNKTKRSL